MAKQIQAVGIIIPLATPNSARLLAIYAKAARMFGPSVCGIWRKGQWGVEYYVATDKQDAVQSFVEKAVSNA
jgi:hypothetical protein